MKIGSANKIQDINANTGGRAYWENIDLFTVKYLKGFKPLRSPNYDIYKVFKPYAVDKIPEVVLNTYKLKGIEFGNWVNQPRRLDFCLNLFIGLYDLNKIVKFNNNIGINKNVGVAYGARGKKGALAHYEPWSNIINISRDRRVDKLFVDFFTGMPLVQAKKNFSLYTQYKNQSRKENSGFGSFAHEYGHAIDYIIADKYLHRGVALSGGSVTLTSDKNPQRALINYDNGFQMADDADKIELAFYDCLTPLLFDNSGKPTGYYKRMYEYATKKKNTYWIRHNEIWARVFETFVAYKLSKQGIKNYFLTGEGKGKYKDELKSNFGRVYPTFNELIKVEKKIDHFLELVSKKIN
jgi:hypothetical protein